MAKKIPTDAFDYYFSLGPSRSYQAVAEKYGASKRAVVGVAKRENWQKRLLEVETYPFTQHYRTKKLQRVHQVISLGTEKSRFSLAVAPPLGGRPTSSARRPSGGASPRKTCLSNPWALDSARRSSDPPS